MSWSTREFVPRRSATKTSRVALGIDPGMAHTGLAIVTRTHNGVYHCEKLVLAASKPTGKGLVPRAQDDARRLKLIHAACMELMAYFAPHVLAVESYAPLVGRQGGSAWKTSVVYGLVHGIGLSGNRPVVAQSPQDIKRAFTLGKNNSKQHVQAMMCKLVQGLDAKLEAVCASKREHLADATAHAVLALDRLVAGKTGGVPRVGA